LGKKKQQCDRKSNFSKKDWSENGDQEPKIFSTKLTELMSQIRPQASLLAITKITYYENIAAFAVAVQPNLAA